MRKADVTEGMNSIVLAKDSLDAAYTPNITRPTNGS